MTSPKDQTRDRGESATSRRHWMALQGENTSRRRCGMMEEGGRRGEQQTTRSRCWRVCFRSLFPRLLLPSRQLKCFHHKYRYRRITNVIRTVTTVAKLSEKGNHNFSLLCRRPNPVSYRVTTTPPRRGTSRKLELTIAANPPPRNATQG
jgi:hypothetical protein